MREEERNKWEPDSLTTRQGCYPAPVRANFPANYSFRHLLTYPTAGIGKPHLSRFLYQLNQSARVVNHKFQILPRLQAR
jgi:hypothetical protein